MKKTTRTTWFLFLLSLWKIQPKVFFFFLSAGEMFLETQVKNHVSCRVFPIFLSFVSFSHVDVFFFSMSIFLCLPFSFLISQLARKSRQDFVKFQFKRIFCFCEKCLVFYMFCEILFFFFLIFLLFCVLSICFKCFFYFYFFVNCVFFEKSVKKETLLLEMSKITALVEKSPLRGEGGRGRWGTRYFQASQTQAVPVGFML